MSNVINFTPNTPAARARAAAAVQFTAAPVPPVPNPTPEIAAALLGYARTINHLQLGTLNMERVAMIAPDMLVHFRPQILEAACTLVRTLNALDNIQPKGPAA